MSESKCQQDGCAKSSDWLSLHSKRGLCDGHFRAEMRSLGTPTIEVGPALEEMRERGVLG